MFFKPTYVYVKIRKNAFWVKQLETQKIVDLIAPEPFTTTRLLVGQLTAARQMIMSAIRQSVVFHICWKAQSVFEKFLAPLATL